MSIKRLNTFIFIIFAFMLFTLVSCDPSSTPKEKYYSNTNSTDLKAENIKSVSIGDSKYDVTSSFGKPKFIDVVENPPYTTYTYGENKDKYDVEFKIENNKISRYILLNSKYHTEKGIHIGVNKKDVIEAYGKEYYERQDAGANVFGYFDKKNKINLEFILDGNSIKGIIITDMLGDK